MERSEPTLVPEWLKNAGSSNGSTPHTDDQTSSKLARNRSFVNSNGHDFGRTFSSDRTTSSYFRRSSSSKGSAHLRGDSSFGRQRDRDWEKDAYDSRERDKSVVADHRRWDFSDAPGNSISKFERDGFRRSHSVVSGKHADTWHKKVVTNSSTNSGTYANGLVTRGSPIGGVKNTFFQRDFPSLGAEERASVPEVGRVPSPGLSSAIQSLPIGSSSIVNGEKWTSALAEVPVLVGSNNGTGILSAQQAAPLSSTSVALGTTSSLNMAEAVAQAPNRGQTIPTLSVGIQRLEELAIKKSRQLIPVTPSTPKALVLNSPDKQKIKVGGPLKGDVSKASNVGKLHVLKPVREKNGTSPTAKDSLSPTGVSKPVSFTLASPTVFDRKPAMTVLEKRSTSQARSRNEFFNSVRKKSLVNTSIADSPTSMSSSVLDSGTAVSPSSSDKLSDMDDVHVPNTSQTGDSSGLSLGGKDLFEVKGDLTRNGDACDEQKHVSNGKKHPSSDPIISEEEEAAFLRSLGWEENADEGGLTEEEISAFFKDVTKYINLKPPLKILQGEEPNFLSPFNSRIGAISAGLSSSNAKLES
ncbi:hypothetical protein ACS0TY_002056 [Phlomoides rotata]